MSDRKLQSRICESTLTNQIRNSMEKLKLAAETLEILDSQFDAAVVEILLAEIDVPALQKCIKSVPETVNSAYLRALLSSRTNDAGRSAAWEGFLRLHAGHDPYHLLAYAQALTEEERFEEAAHQLRLVLTQQVPYTFFARAEKLVEKLVSQDLAYLRKTRIAVLGSSTTSLMVPLLKALCLRDRIRVEIYEGLYGAMTQEILDAESSLSNFRPDIVFLIQNWRDLSLPPVSSDAETVIARIVEAQKVLWKRLSSQFGCHVVQHAFDFPDNESYGYLASSLPGGRLGVLAAINNRMQQEASSHVSILDTEAVQRRIGEGWQDQTLWCMFKQHPSTAALPALAEAQQAHVRAVLGLTRKVLVTDLDNTLWKGVIAEDGLGGIQVGPETPAGEAHQHLQKYLLELKSRGILLAVCSKNDPEEARAPFEQHEHMVLRLADFTAFYANWDDKAENLRRLAGTLSLGLDSFVFLDDNPLEREWVRSQLPEVAVVNLGPSAFNWTRDLDRGYYFFSLVLSGEDVIRAEQYRSAQQREKLRATSPSIEEFLRQLQLEAAVEPVSEMNLSRVAQLVNKTNQFNLTAKRYTEEQLRQVASLTGAWGGAFRLRDRLGSYGLVSVLLCKPGSDTSEWEIDLWLISCRALGRQLERFMFGRMIEAAANNGVRRITGIYRPTEKNSLVANLYEKLGFRKLHESREHAIYSIEVSERPQIATYIQNVSTCTYSHGWPVEAVAA